MSLYYTMPKTPKDFSKAVIYRIVCRNLEIKDTYVGSTTNLTQRKKSHKYSCNTPQCKTYGLPVYEFIREHGGWDAWDIILVESFPCLNKDELHARERYHIELLGATLNRSIPTRTDAEYYEAHKEAIKDKVRRWRADNPERSGAYEIEYRETHKDAIRERDKQYYESHKEAIKDKVRRWREAKRITTVQT